jgi:hypothetical protein
MTPLKFGRESSDSIKVLRFSASRIMIKSFGSWGMFGPFSGGWRGKFTHPVNEKRTPTKRQARIRFLRRENLGDT